jgi:hypothetical protein
MTAPEGQSGLLRMMGCAGPSTGGPSSDAPAVAPSPGSACSDSRRDRGCEHGYTAAPCTCRGASASGRAFGIGDDRHTIGQQSYAHATDTIRALDLLCSGFQPVPTEAAAGIEPAYKVLQTSA